MAMRKTIIALLGVLALTAFFAIAGPEAKEEVEIGTAQPETEGSGWDQSPASGGWGGRGADGSFAVVWQNDSPDVPANFGRWAQVTIPGQPGMVPTKIEVFYLAGIANDDFCVFVEKFKSSSPSSPTHWVAIDCEDEDESNTDEQWTKRVFDLPPKVFHPGQDISVQIRATGNAWSGRGTWGQVAIDYIKVVGVQGHGK
jgi:hypothetical protein